jgi:lipopolysaccharide biosynthesis glycosyltransferase
LKNFIKTVKTFDYIQPSEDRTICHVCYNVNDPFISIMGASIVSVLANNKRMDFVFHIFTDGYTTENEDKIKKVAEKWHCCCVLYELDMNPFADFHIKVARFSRITYARIYMPKVLSGKVQRFIYIDADAMCVKSLHSLYTMDLQGAAMGAVSEKPEAVTQRAGFLKLSSGAYFNDGIMLVDVEEWERQHITEQCFAYQCEPRNRFLGQSQDILNLVFNGKNYFLPAVYNMYGGGSRDQGDSVFVHWTGRRKPWQMVLTDFDAQWREYNALSPWETLTNIMPVKKPENYHDFQQWGRYQRLHGNTSVYLRGIFWYAWLRLRYKIGI